MLEMMAAGLGIKALGGLFGRNHKSNVGFMREAARNPDMMAFVEKHFGVTLSQLSQMSDKDVQHIRNAWDSSSEKDTSHRLGTNRWQFGDPRYQSRIMALMSGYASI
jgi:hypothetical protein